MRKSVWRKLLFNITTTYKLRNVIRRLTVTRRCADTTYGACTGKVRILSAATSAFYRV